MNYITLKTFMNILTQLAGMKQDIYCKSLPEIRFKVLLDNFDVLEDGTKKLKTLSIKVANEDFLNPNISIANILLSELNKHKIFIDDNYYL